MHQLGKITNFKGQFVPFSIPQATRLLHIWALGKTGSGKSSFLKSSILQDIKSGIGFTLIDPHGDLAEDILKHIPEGQTPRVIYFNPQDKQFPVGFNPFYHLEGDDKELLYSAILETMKHLSGEHWGMQLEQIAGHAIPVILDHPRGTFLHLEQFLMGITDKKKRKKFLKYVKDPHIKAFWMQGFSNLFTNKEQKDRTLSTFNKITQFTMNPTIRNIVGQYVSRLRFEDVLDADKIVVVNLSGIGEQNANILGSLLITKLHAAARKRKNRSLYPVYIDEFQQFGTTSFLEMLSGIRKFGIALSLANQYVDQIPIPLQNALIGNVGTLVAFRLGYRDAKALAPEFDLPPRQLMNTPRFSAYTNHLAQGLSIPLPQSKEYPQSPERIVRNTRKRYAQPLNVVEQRVNKTISGGTDEGGR